MRRRSEEPKGHEKYEEREEEDDEDEEKLEEAFTVFYVLLEIEDDRCQKWKGRKARRGNMSRM